MPPPRRRSALRLPAIDADADHTNRLAACERQLRRAGLPLLIHDYSAAEDIFTRALPFFGTVALFEVAGAFNADWSFGANVAACLGGAVLLVVSYGVVNRLRNRPFALPSRVGVPELAAFVLLPPLLPLVFGGQLGSAALTALANLALIGLAWAVIGFGFFSIMRWAGARLFAQLAASLTLMVRALPLILFFGLLSFFTTEMWQLFSEVSAVRYLTTLVLFVVIGLAFLTVRLPQSVHEVERTVELDGVPLRRIERINLGLVILISQVLQILLVTALVWLFFSTFGALLVDISVVESWTGAPPDPIFDLSLFGEQIVVSRQLVWAAFGIAAFSGLYYTVGMLVDATYRDEFVSELTDQMRSTFAIRSEYLRLLDPVDSGDSQRPQGADPVSRI